MVSFNIINVIFCFILSKKGFTKEFLHYIIYMWLRCPLIIFYGKQICLTKINRKTTLYYYCILIKLSNSSLTPFSSIYLMFLAYLFFYIDLFIKLCAICRFTKSMLYAIIYIVSLMNKLTEDYMKRRIKHVPEISGCYGMRVWIPTTDTELIAFIKPICIWGGPTSERLGYGGRELGYELPLGIESNPLWQQACRYFEIELVS